MEGKGIGLFHGFAVVVDHVEAAGVVIHEVGFILMHRHQLYPFLHLRTPACGKINIIGGPVIGHLGIFPPMGICEISNPGLAFDEFAVPVGVQQNLHPRGHIFIEPLIQYGIPRGGILGHQVPGFDLSQFHRIETALLILDQHLVRGMVVYGHPVASEKHMVTAQGKGIPVQAGVAEYPGGGAVPVGEQLDIVVILIGQEGVHPALAPELEGGPSGKITGDIRDGNGTGLIVQLHIEYMAPFIMGLDVGEGIARGPQIEIKEKGIRPGALQGPQGIITGIVIGVNMGRLVVSIPIVMHRGHDRKNQDSGIAVVKAHVLVNPPAFPDIELFAVVGVGFAADEVIGAHHIGARGFHRSHGLAAVTDPGPAFMAEIDFLDHSAGPGLEHLLG